MRRDHAAVLNGLTLPHSSGAVEGMVNRITMIKRQMYGRAEVRQQLGSRPEAFAAGRHVQSPADRERRWAVTMTTSPR
ncbi:MAG TPA: hypothetical protein VK735_16220 [Pseudonocardia sp.]|nr:hypothetical protein [Pseudonocardia sp.]